MTDIIDRIRQKAPSAIDIMHQDMERRNALDNDRVNAILTKVFMNIDGDRLSPSLSLRWNKIKAQLPC